MPRYMVNYWLFKKLAEGVDERKVNIIVEDPSVVSTVLAHVDLRELHVIRTEDKRAHKKKPTLAKLIKD